MAPLPHSNVPAPAAASVEYRILGPLEIRTGGSELHLGHTREQRVMAALLLDAGRVVSLERLVDELWDEDPPETAPKLVRNCVSALRSRFAAAPGAVIETHPSGYLLEIGGAYLDTADFAERIGRARSFGAAGRLAEAVAEARAALALWRGPALAGLRGRMIQAAATNLDEQRLSAVEECMSWELEQGAGAGLVAELSQLVAEHPWRERLRAQLMRALYQCGRRAEALDTYRAGRRALVEQLGIEPGPELRQLNQDILNDDPALVAAVERPAGSPRPAQLPAGATSFTGRAEHLRQLDKVLANHGFGPAGAVTVCVIGGTAGVGKTALAVQWAHRVREQFPDGQLFVDLYGYGPNPPVRPVDALAHFLRALGVGAEQIPVEVDEAAGLYRSLLADRRVLVVVDNAASAEQVRPLLPGGHKCLVVVTSRVRLSGLVAHDDARLLTLDVLTPAEAESLLRRLAGEDRVGAEADAVARLAELCAYLPLALRIAAAHLGDHPRLPVADYVAQLEAGNRLAALAIEGDDRSAVPAAFDLSYTALDREARLVFRRLGLMPAADTSTEAVAALAGLPAADAARALGRLTRAHLAEERTAGRYTFHDLLRYYAAGRALSDDSEPERVAAAGRQSAWYLGRTDAAAVLLYPEILRLRQGDAGDDGFDSPAAALAWLDVERANLVALAVGAAEQGRPSLAWQLADALRGYFHLRMCTVDWLTVAVAALSAAEAAGDVPAQAAARLSLGDLHWRISRYAEATAHYREAAALAARGGWGRGAVSIHGNLGNVYQQSGALRDAAQEYQRALALAEQTGWLHGRAANLENLGSVYWEMGRLTDAADHLSRAAAILTQSGSRFAHAVAVSGLGEVRHAQGRLAEAAGHLATALAQHREVGNRGGEAETLRLLAVVARDEGRLPDSLALVTSALTLAREAGDRRFEADALTTLASVSLLRGEPQPAIETYGRALDLAREIGHQYPEVEALIGLATAYRRLADPEQAIRYARDAVTVARDAGYRMLEGRAWSVLAECRRDHGLPAEAESAATLAATILRDCAAARGVG
jgi:DNA-binding SARP family transcriptional activator